LGLPRPDDSGGALIAALVTAPPPPRISAINLAQGARRRQAERAHRLIALSTSLSLALSSLVMT